MKNFGLLGLVIAGSFVLLSGDAISAGTKTVAKPKAAAKAAKATTKVAKATTKVAKATTKVAKGATTKKVTGATSKPITATATTEGPKPIPYNGPPVLDPGKFSGAAMMGYASAKAAPGVMAQIFCYCGCDISDSHSWLIDCFTGMHGVDCHYCQEEAVLALRLYRDGASMAEIQKNIDQEYSKVYPFTEESPTYKKYKATRLWTKAETPAATAPGTTPWKPVVKPGMTAGECCAKDEHKDQK